MGAAPGAKQYLQILTLAARRGESLVEGSLRAVLKEDPERLSAALVAELLEGNVPHAPITAVEVESVSLTVFDELLTGGEVTA
jgi:hypothetical protein